MPIEPDHNLYLAEILCSRLCHDLIGPVGAINNGLELMAEMGIGEGDEAMELVRASAQSAADKLQVFRLAFGAAGRAAANMSFADAAKLVQLLRTSRITPVWDAAHQPVSPSPGDGAIKLLLNMVMLASESLGSGGTVRVEVKPGDNGFKAPIIAEPSRGEPRLHDEAAAALDPSFVPRDFGARAVLAYYTRLLAEQIGGGMAIQAVEGRLEFTTGLPIAQP